jgi:hypothetical protein
VLIGLTQRIDNRLGEAQAGAQGVRADLRSVADPGWTRAKSRLLFTFNLLALLATLMLAWILYSTSRCHSALPTPSKG